MTISLPTTPASTGYLRIKKGDLKSQHVELWKGKKYLVDDFDKMRVDYINPTQISNITEFWAKDEKTQEPKISSTTLTLSNGKEFKVDNISKDEIVKQAQQALQTGKTIDLVG